MAFMHNQHLDLSESAARSLAWKRQSKTINSNIYEPGLNHYQGGITMEVDTYTALQ